VVHPQAGDPIRNAGPARASARPGANPPQMRPRTGNLSADTEVIPGTLRPANQHTKSSE